MQEDLALKAKGAKWWQSKDNASPELTKASMGRFVYEALKVGAQIDMMLPFNAEFDNTPVIVTIYMTDEQRATIERQTEFRFGPIISFVSASQNDFDFPA